MKFHRISLLLSLPIAINSAAQNVGIGTTSPVALLHVADSNVLFTGPNPFVNYNPAALPPAQGAGTRLMWYPPKAAFRAGWVENNRWDKDSIGVFSIGLGHSVLALNTGSVATGVRTRATGFGATAMGWESEAAGDYSIAIGFQSKALQQISVAIGSQNIASGFFSTAIGNNNRAIGTSAVALGDLTTVTGTSSVAAGADLKVKARSAFAAGWLNDTSDSPDPLFITPTDRIFQIGNGNGFLGTRSNALTVLRNANTGIATTNPRFPLSFNSNNGDKISLYDDGNVSQLHFGFGIFSNQLLQIHSATLFDDIAFGYGTSASFTERMRIKGNGKVGINTTSPLAYLHVADSSVLFTGPASLPVVSPGPPPVQGIGTRLMWYPEKGAFRAGYVFAQQWDKDSIGLFSVALGNSNIARGESSFAMGSLSTATSAGAVAVGVRSKASGGVSVAFGVDVSATGDRSFATGDQTTASGHQSTAMGYATIASGDRSMATGYATVASGFNSIAMGFGATAPGNYAVSIGSNSQAVGGVSLSMGDNSIARGNFATSIGLYTIARSDNSFVVGKYNDTTATNRLFEIGNGTAVNARSNAVTVLQNGSTLITAPATLPGIPATTPATGNGYRMMWYADKASFRVGQAIADSWDKDNIGNVSFATGAATRATGITSFAAGNFSYAIGDASTAAGFSVQAKALGGAAFGIYNDITDNPSASTTAATNRIFQIGNGSTNISRTNAMTILRNGNIGVGGVTNPARTLSFPPVLGEKILLYPGATGEVGIGVYGNELRIHTDYAPARISFGYQDNAGNFTQTMWLNNSTSVLTVGGTAYASDERFKKQVVPMQNALNKVLALDGVEYYLRKEEFPQMQFSSQRQTGLLAQQVEKVMPSAVYDITDDGYKGVDYAKLVPLLVESIKEQQRQIEELKTKIKSLEKN